MAYFPTLPSTQTSSLMTDAFLGLNKDLSIGDGEFSDMTNMTADEYPVLSTRKRRTYVAWNGDSHSVPNPQGLIGTEKMVVINNGVIYVDGEIFNGLRLSNEAEMQPKHTVCMGAYVCIWPDKKYINLANPDDYGDMGALWTVPTDRTVTAMMCRKDGTNYDTDNITVSATAPADPEDQQMWIDTSGDNDVLKQYSETYDEWVQVATTYIKIQASNIGKKFKEGDVVFLSGARVDTSGSPGTETSTETLTFTTEDFRLKSTFTTSVDASGNIVNSSPTRAERTKTIEVTGIPDGAVVKRATLNFKASNPAHGYQVLTVNGQKAVVGDNTIAISDVAGNGEVSLKFVFSVWAHGTTVGTNSGVVGFSDITLEVTYETSGTASSAVSGATIHAIADLNTSCYLYGAGDHYIIVAGLIRESVTLRDILKVELKIPDLDYVCEANNRLWGCSFSSVDGVLVNEIRACALGDFRNWYLFEGTSMDSYTVSVGSDGRFTGAYSMKGNPLFFKENVMHRISGTQPSNFTLNTTMCRGVQEGCWRSLAQVNETLYYKARTDVMAYDGSLPRSVSEKLGLVRFHEASAGAYRDKYYISMRDDDINWSMFVYDTQKGLWHREDAALVHHFASTQDGLFFIDERVYPGKLTSVDKIDGLKEPEFEWSATFGDFGYQLENQKYLSRFNIRAQIQAGGSMKMEIMYDSNGEWVDEGTVRCPFLRTFMIPVIPRRCDHCRIRLSGKGEARIYSVARILDVGGDG